MNSPKAEASAVPPIPREFRGAWIATVNNIDWPSKPGLPVETQKSELLAILDRAAALHLNAVILQVRPACDALYASRYEPWSEYLTGAMGKAPEPLYDPLEFAVSEAHRRGLELHAWFNPYRARHPSAKSPITQDHVSKRYPAICKQYGRYLWLDPGEDLTKRHVLNVILDVVTRYDVDGVHLDDYFYPYKEKDAEGRDLDFPDEPSYRKYQQTGGKLSRDDWRRQNVDAFIETLYGAVKKRKPWVKVGISPFGIWRPGYPPQIQGFDAYSQLYADSRKWLQKGWLDYLAPQLYWPIARKAQSFQALLLWWIQNNVLRRHLWPGLYTSMVDGDAGKAWPVDEILNQVRLTRQEAGSGGAIHFSMKALMPGHPAGEALRTGPYAQPALVPECSWLSRHAPSPPRISVKLERARKELIVELLPGRRKDVRLWLIQVRSAGRWDTTIWPGEERRVTLRASSNLGPGDCVAVSWIDRFGTQSKPSVHLPGRH
ncbi:MAG: glycoside hydrolase family 10 protein [Chthonomonadales bacterium]